MRSMTVYNFLLEATLLGSGLILLLCAARAFLRGRVGSRLLCAAWLMVALRLLLPLSLPNPLMNELRPTRSTDMAARPVADQVRVRMIDAAWDLAAFLRGATGGDGVSEWIEEVGSRTYDGQTGSWLLLGYGLTAAAVGCGLTAKRHRFRAYVLRNRVSPLQGEELLAYHRLCLRFGVPPAPVYYVDKLSAPCVVGTFQPMIALPLGENPLHLQSTLIRELSLLKGREGLWALVRQLCCAVHWFNPLVWMAAKMSRADGELAADERACRRMDDGERLRYAEALARASQAASPERDEKRQKAREQRLRQRMNAVLNDRPVKPWAATLAVAACAVFLLASFATEEKFAPISISVIPKVLWRAGAENVATPADAVGCARRFLESPYVEIDTAYMRFEARMEQSRESEPYLWRVTGLSLDGRTDVLLRFYSDGTLMEYNGLSQIDDVNLSAREKTAPVPSESVREYLRGFAEACLPNQKWVKATSRDDAAGERKRFLLFDLKLINEGTALPNVSYTAKLGALLDDQVRVVYYAMPGESL